MERQTKYEKQSYILASCSTALLGRVTPILRAVTGDYNGEVVTLIFFHEGELEDEYREEFECASTEVISDFPIHAMLDCKIIRIDPPQKPQLSGLLIYRRFEHRDGTLVSGRAGDPYPHLSRDG